MADTIGHLIISAVVFMTLLSLQIRLKANDNFTLLKSTVG